jgi:hypothetical protein
MITVLKEKQVGTLLDGTYNVGSIDNITYKDLFRILGEPTYNKPSGDNKTQVEWNLNFNNEVYSIYDWKTYNREYTLNNLDHWNIGGRTDPSGLIDYINERK